MKTNKALKILIQSGDRSLTAKEQKILAAGLKTNPELAEDAQLLQKIQNKFANAIETSFSPWFPERTMNRILQLTNQQKRLIWLPNGLKLAYRRVVVGAIIIVTLLVILNLSTGNNPNLAKAFGVAPIPIEDMIDPISNFIWEL
jgi:hypothetical protein